MSKAPAEDGVPRLAVVIDEARTLVANARASGLRPTGIRLAAPDLGVLEREKSYEDRALVPLQLLGLPIATRPLEPGHGVVSLEFGNV